MVPRSGVWVTDDFPVTMIVRGAMMVCEDSGNNLQLIIRNPVSALKAAISESVTITLPNAKPQCGGAVDSSYHFHLSVTSQHIIS